MEQEGIGTGFWIEGFGEIELVFYPDYDLEVIKLTPEKCYYINQKALQAMEKIFNLIDDPSLFDGD